MSPDEDFVRQLVQALKAAGIEAVLVGTGAAILQGVPIVTDDLDILIRDTPLNRRKLVRLAEILGGAWIDISELTRARRLVDLRAGVDVLFDEISGGLRFESLRSRAVRIRLGTATAVAAALPDIIASKEAAGRPKDLAQLPILRDTIRVKSVVEQVSKRQRRRRPR